MAEGADQGLIATARQLAPLIRDGIEEAERERRLPAATAGAMAKAGLYMTGVLRAHGGHEAGPATTIRLIETVSEVHGSAGWNLMIGLETAGAASPWISDQAAKETFGADPCVIMAGAVNPKGRARAVEGGWVLDGRWPFISGCQNAQWFSGGAVVVDGEGQVARTATGQPVLRQLLVPAGEFEVIDTWRVAGMRASGSHDVEVRGAFVPAHRVLDTSAPTRFETPLARYPLIARFSYTKPGVAAGIARTAIAAFIELAGSKTPFLARSLLRDRAHAQLAAAEADVTLRAGRAGLFEAVGEVWEEVSAGREPSMDLRVRQRLAAAHSVACSVRAVDLVHSAAGASANFESSPLERCFRDVHVVPQHVTVTPAYYETAGRHLLGLPLEPTSY